MMTLRLVSWNADDAQKRAMVLTQLGYRVSADVLAPPLLLRRLREEPPVAVVIDLSRLPSHGREFGRAVRTQKSTRQVPLVFAGGEPSKVAKVRTLLPDAVYAEWEQIGPALKQAVARPVKDPFIPKAYMDEFAGRSVVQKLGIKPRFAVATIGAPRGFAGTLGDLPEGTRFHAHRGGPCDLLLWFVRTQVELERGVARVVPAGCPCWILWPKRAANVRTDITQNSVRATGLAAGLVDYKVCSVDAVWSGLLFRWRRP
jgi:hypothetical protein